MPTRQLDPADPTPRERAFWLVLAAVAASQLLAFYLVCTHQVRESEVRRTAAVVQQVAFTDCPRAVDGLPASGCAPGDAPGRTTAAR
jgi:hypothetical protein